MKLTGAGNLPQGNITLQPLELHGNGVRAYRVIQEPLAAGASLPDPGPMQLTGLGEDLRRQIHASLELRLATAASNDTVAD